MFETTRGTIIVQGALARPANIPLPERNAFEGIPGTVRSEDRGATWRRWFPRADQGDGPTSGGGWVQLRNGAILMFDWLAGFDPRAGFVGKRWKSTDDGKTVIGPLESHWNIPNGDGGGFADNGRPQGGVRVHRSILELPGGDLIAAVYGRLQGDNAPSSYMPSMHRFRCMLMRSKNEGRDWNYVATIAVDPSVGQEGFNESTLVRLSRGPHAGRLLCVMRVGRQNPLYQAYSDDDGRTWSKAMARNLVGVDPDLIELQDGTLACSFGHKPDCNDDGNFLAFSFDQGENWSQIVRISQGLTGAYTSVCELAPGRLFFVYEVRDGSYRSFSRRILGRTVQLEAGP
jgi:hypothetical protein